MPFKLILGDVRLFSNVWSENTALFERLMGIHSNSPKLYYGSKTMYHNGFQQCSLWTMHHIILHDVTSGGCKMALHNAVTKGTTVPCGTLWCIKCELNEDQNIIHILKNLKYIMKLTDWARSYMFSVHNLGMKLDSRNMFLVHERSYYEHCEILSVLIWFEHLPMSKVSGHCDSMTCWLTWTCIAHTCRRRFWWRKLSDAESGLNYSSTFFLVYNSEH